MDGPPTHFDLPGLPNELLLKIIEHEVHHQDLENLTLCSKAVFNLGKQARAAHLKRKNNTPLFKQATCAPTMDLEASKGLIFLHLVLCKLDSFATEVNINGLEGDICHRMKFLFEGRASGDTMDFDEWDNLGISQDHEGACSALFALMANVEFLEIVEGFMFIEQLTRIFLSIRHTHCVLREVRVFCEQQHGDQFSTVAVFAFIPSVRKIYGHNIQDLSGMSVEAILLRDSIASAGHRAIQDRFAGILLSQLSRSLERLALVGVATHTDVPPGASHHTFSSLREFPVLKHVAVDFPFLVHTRPRTAWPDLTFQDESADPEDLANETTDRTLLRLVDVLPASVEILVLHNPTNKDDLEAIFSDLAQLKEQRLPKLRSIVIKGKDLCIQGIEDDCRQTDISFEFQDDSHLVEPWALESIELLGL
ncbi:MAG: hypothetical protein Q9226_007299 [Calogaya cf. arnoldii]